MTSVNDKLEKLLISSRWQRETNVDTYAINFFRAQLGDAVLKLLLCTQEAQEKAVSYRSFNVGAGVLAVRHAASYDSPHGLGSYFGVNVKVDETDTINIHAEDLAVGKAAEARADAISVLTVIGPTQEDHASGKHTHTLHPCGRCRDRLSKHPLIHPATLIVTARPDFKVVEVSSLNGIRKAHDEEDSSGIATFELHDSEELFTPLSELEKLPYIKEADDEEWQVTVGAYLLDRYAYIMQQLSANTKEIEQA